MKRRKNWLLPLLTVLIVLTVTFLPRHLSDLQDQKLFGQVHTQALTAETILPTQSPDLARRVELLANWMEGSEVMSALQALTDDTICQELASAVLDGLRSMADSGALPAELLPGDLSSMEASQIYLQQQLVGAEYYMIDSVIKDENIFLSIVLDAETKQMLWLQLSHPKLEGFYEQMSPVDIGTFFVEHLGIESTLIEAGAFDADFQIADLDLQYSVLLEPYFLQIIPMATDLHTEGESSSAAVG